MPKCKRILRSPKQPSFLPSTLFRYVFLRADGRVRGKNVNAPDVLTAENYAEHACKVYGHSLLTLNYAK